MSVNYLHLRAFHAIAVDSGISKAARRLNVSQPTLSQQLKALEKRYGVAMFESRKTPLRLTAAGRDLFALTQKLFATVADIDDMLGETAGLTGGTLRLGSDNPFYAARVAGLFRARHPQVAIQVRMGNARDVMRWLGDAQIDAALASDPTRDDIFGYEALGTDRLSCVLPADHPLAGQAAIPIGALADDTLLLREATSKTRAVIERALADAAVAPRRIIEMHSRETIREAVACGLGLSVFFTSECPPDSRIAYRPLDTAGRDYVLTNYLVYQSERRRVALVQALRAIAIDFRAF